MTNPGQTLTKASLLVRVWGLDTDADENSVEAYVSFLRKKLSYLGSDLRIVTVRGMGYRMEVSETGRAGGAGNGAGGGAGDAGNGGAVDDGTGGLDAR
jgi:hypothetical protein